MASRDLRQWLALSALPGIGPARLKLLHGLVAAFSWDALPDAVLLAAGFAPAFCTAVQQALCRPLTDTVQRQLDAVETWQAGHPARHAISLSDSAYPPLLREIPDPPPVLFVQGHPDVLALPQLGIVGTRCPSADGRRNARQFAAALSRAGYQITSGLAEGIDAESHAGALDSKGITIAVFGTGLGTVYPKRHRKLAAAVAETGALVSELLPDAGPAAHNFPARNRIISGLSHGVLIVEAARRSGSLITARLATEQGREVFVIPGSIHNPMTRGCHHLIRQGAKLVETVSDVLEEIPALLAWEASRAAPDAAISQTNGGQVPDIALDAASAGVLQLIAYDPISVDALAQQTGLAMPQLYAALMTLELNGKVSKQAGGYVIRLS